MVVVVHHRCLGPVCSHGQVLVERDKGWLQEPVPPGAGVPLSHPLGKEELWDVSGEETAGSTTKGPRALTRFHPILRPHSLQFIPLVSVREMQNDRVAWR